MSGPGGWCLVREDSFLHPCWSPRRSGKRLHVAGRPGPVREGPGDPDSSPDSTLSHQRTLGMSPPSLSLSVPMTIRSSVICPASPIVDVL